MNNGTKEMIPHSDETLLQQASGGDETAFEELVRRYQGGVINLIYRYVHDANDAEDLAAEVFFRIWKYASQFKGKSKFSTWCYRIAVNVCLNHRKAAATRPLFEYIDATINTEEGEWKKEIPEPGHTQPENTAQAGERDASVSAAVNALPPQQRMAFILSWFEGRSYKEIADIMEVSLGAIESLLFRAKENLRKQLIDKI